jgi:hypothetical protein
MTDPSLSEPLLAQDEEELPIGDVDQTSDAGERRITHIGELDLLGDIDRSTLPAPASQLLDSSMDSNYESTIQESSTLVNNLHQNPSHEPLLVNDGQQLEYEPEEYETTKEALNKSSSGRNTKDRDSATGLDRDLVTKCNEPALITCPYCNTTAETTTVNAFGTCTLIWVVILSIVCFPLCWLPLLWREVSKLPADCELCAIVSADYYHHDIHCTSVLCHSLQCHDTKHFCTYCGRELGIAKAKCCGQAKKVEKDIEGQARSVGEKIEGQVEEEQIFL